MELVTLLQNLSTTIASLQLQLVDAQAALDVQVKASYDKGFAEGVASVVLPPASDKIYSQAELDKVLAETVGPLQEQVNGIPALVDQKVVEALTQFKTDLLVKIVDLENLLK